MKRKINLLLLFTITFWLLPVTYLNSQTFRPDSIQYRYWIYFKDKGIYKEDDNLGVNSEGYSKALSGISEKALKRRAKVLPSNRIVSFQDLPVYESYVDQITQLGVRINAVSKWFNAVSVNALTKDLTQIASLGFVKRIEGVHYFQNVEIKSPKLINHTNYNIVNEDKLKYNYGPSFWQVEQINVPILHYCGITGWGVTVGMCDCGFSWRNHQCLSGRRVLGEYDWLYGDDSVQTQYPPNQYPADKWDQDGHGTSTFSVLGGFKEGELIGPAFDASVYLSKTEDNNSETPVEEDYWVEAVEWMEAQGIDVLSCSLIYKPFDSPNNSYDYADMDGKTTVIARASEMLVHLGVVVCNSMGNERQKNPPSIVSPADGDSVISVGAVDSAGVIASFSSNGPTSDGRMKPDVVAMGVDDWTAESETISENDSTYSYSNGTSFSCPLTAGVCALILSTHPELTPMQVKEALKMTANNKDNPNNVYGWGLINAYEAALYYGMIFSNKPEFSEENADLKISIYILSKNFIDTKNVMLHYCINGENEFKTIPLELAEKLDDNNSGRYSVSLNLNFEILKLYFTAKDAKQSSNSPYGAPERFFLFKKTESEILIY